MIVAVISRKGGVGKTTTCVSLGAALAEMGRQTLLIDLDSQASASLSLGVRRDELAPSSADVLLRSMPAGKAVRKTRISGLDLITASADLASVDQELSPYSTKEMRLRAAIRPLAERYEYVLLDCPPALSLVALSALVASDGFVIPVVPHYLSLEGVQNLMTAAERLTDRFGVRTRPLGFVLTMVDYRTRANRDNVALIRQEYREQVFAIEIRTNIRLAEAPGRGLTIFEYDAASVGARSYRLLAEEFLLRAGTLAKESEPQPFAALRPGIPATPTATRQPLPSPQPSLPERPPQPEPEPPSPTPATAPVAEPAAPEPYSPAAPGNRAFDELGEDGSIPPDRIH